MTTDDYAAADVAYWRKFFPPPTAEELRRHLERFGSREHIEHIATVYQVNLKRPSGSVAWKVESGRLVRDLKTEARVSKAKATGRLKKARRTTDELRGQVRKLHDDGLMPGAISRRLNVGDRRVRELLAN